MTLFQSINAICVFFIFVFARNMYFGYTLETPQRSGSNEYPHSILHVHVLEPKRYSPVNPDFTIYNWDVRGSTLHDMMDKKTSPVLMTFFYPGV